MLLDLDYYEIIQVNSLIPYSNYQLPFKNQAYHSSWKISLRSFLVTASFLAISTFLATPQESLLSSENQGFPTTNCLFSPSTTTFLPRTLSLILYFCSTHLLLPCSTFIKSALFSIPNSPSTNNTSPTFIST